MNGSSASSICGLAKIHWHDRHGVKACSAIVFEQESHTMRVSTTSPLPLFTRVGLALGGLEHLAQVESVRASDQGHEAELALQETRRVDERIAHEASMLLQPTESDGSSSVTVRATNYSSGGFQIASDEPLAEDLPIHLTADGMEYYGVTRYCHRAASGYLIGIELVEPPLFSEC